MLFADSGSGRAELLAGEVGGTHAGSLEELADGSDLIVLAVKPAALEDVAGIIDGRSEAVASVLGLLVPALEQRGTFFVRSQTLRRAQARRRANARPACRLSTT